MKVGGYKLSALEIEAVLLEVCFSYFVLYPTWLKIFTKVHLLADVIFAEKMVYYLALNELNFCSIQLFQSVVCWVYPTKTTEKLCVQ